MAPFLERGDARVSLSRCHGWHPHFLLRAGELHSRTSPPSWAKRQSCATYFVAAGPELGRHPHRRWASGGPCRPLDRERPSPTSTSPGFNIDRLHAVPDATPSTAPAARWNRSGSSTQCAPTGQSLDGQSARGREAVRRYTNVSSCSGAYFRDVSGWEMRRLVRRDSGNTPDHWAAHVGPAGRGSISWRRRAPRPARDGVIVMDMSFMSKFAGGGPRRRGGCSSSSRPTGSTPSRVTITYTPWLNEGGTHRG